MIYKGRIAETGEPCRMQNNGYWTAAGGRHITSYIRIDVETEYNKAGRPVFRQYTKDRYNNFYVETEDDKHEY